MKLVWYIFHNSKGTLFVWVKGLKMTSAQKWHKIATSRCCPFKRLIPCVTKVTPSCSIFLPEFRRRSRVHQNAFANVLGIHYSISPMKNMLEQRTLTVVLVCRFYFVLYEVQIFLEWTTKKKWKRIHEASKKCTNITKMERHIYILIEISALFFLKTAMLCIFSAFSRRFISV